jgi:protein involved in polysaccharide export with SLBB domain
MEISRNSSSRDFGPAFRETKTFGRIVLTALLLFASDPLFARDQEEDAPVVRICGQVSRPGEFEWRGPIRVIEWIAVAGGPMPAAAMGRVRVYRDGKWIELDLTDERALRDEIAKPGDCIEVPRKNVIGR